MARETVKDNKLLYAIWNTEKNEQIGLSPDKVTCGSKTVAWWKCDNGHEYDMPILKKDRNPKSCPICTGHRVIKGINDFETMYPDIAKEWHPTKNGDLLPSDFSKKNEAKVWWICEYGHEWEARIHDRADSNAGCPECRKRNLTSFPEQAILFYIKKLYPDAINRYKDIFDNGMELDIYVPSARFGIEFDGANWHRTEEQHIREVKKYNICKNKGIKLLRVKESNNTQWDDVSDYTWYVEKKNNRELEQIISAILYSVDRRENMWFRRTRDQFVNLIDVNLERDGNTIRSYLTAIPNSLVELRPDVVLDWDYDKNFPLVPEMFGINSNDYAYWKCHKCGEEWRTTIIHRAGKRNSGCPVCAQEKKGKSFTKRRVEERGSLAENNPELAKQWHPNKNGDLTPFDVTEKRFEAVWWLCDKCGHEWEASPNNRAKGVGCPACSGRVPIKGVNDLKTVNPKLADDWNYEKNGDKQPEEFLPNSGQVVWWKCKKCGHEWEREIRARNKGSYCPNCGHRRKKGYKNKTDEQLSIFDL